MLRCLKSKYLATISVKGLIFRHIWSLHETRTKYVFFLCWCAMVGYRMRRPELKINLSQQPTILMYFFVTQWLKCLLWWLLACKLFLDWLSQRKRIKLLGRANQLQQLQKILLHLHFLKRHKWTLSLKHVFQNSANEHNPLQGRWHKSWASWLP